MVAYESVMAPITIGNVEIPNRVVRTAHATGLAMNADDGGDLAAYHSAAARSGVGLTIIEAASTHPTTTARIRFDDDSQLSVYSGMLRALRKYPMKVFQQLVHSGRAFMTPHGDPPWSASAVPSPRIAHAELSQTPLAITKGQIDEIVESFARAARRVVDAGIDGLEINAAHGYFIAQFMSPLTNKRTDGYGGSRHNRVRILTEILTAVRDEIGPSVPLGARISADEVYPGAITSEEAKSIVDIVNATGTIDFLDISLGSPMNVTKVIGGMEEPLGYELPYSRPVAARATVPTIVAGRITSLEQADELVRTGVADMVAMTRAHIADPELIAKSLSGAPHRVRPCIGCNQGCVGAASSPFARFGCAVNPDAGFEKVIAEPPAATGGMPSFLVIGGGPAGMEAARTAATSGSRVILCEAADALGGQLRIARQAPHRARIGAVADWLANEMSELGVDVRFNTRVTVEQALAFACDRIIVATGSLPRSDGATIADPNQAVRGVDLPHVVRSWDAITDGDITSRRALVYDDIGHHEAVSVAEALLARGCEVTFVTRLNRLMPLLESARMETTVKKRLSDERFEFIGDSKVVEVRSGHVVVQSIYGQRTRCVEADLVSFVGANIPQRDLADGLKTVADVSLVGDALGPRFLQLAILEGHRAAAAPGLLPGSARRF